ncbi:hypothetical protein DPMN_117075 [Dreissena polymorpha]|uniref:Uncharacterized protein n=1 Tax=Dreissena polymorpha TaxID=45954 RepID=A0A9D4QU42_DREPO|nr:hypothetical protein DPMN_117075 [Dreissena polymorpha]
MDRKWRRSVLDVRVMRGADAASDHQLLEATIKTKLRTIFVTLQEGFTTSSASSF